MLKDLFTYLTPEEKDKKRIELIKEQLRDYYNELPIKEKELVEEGLFMEFLGELENKINAMIQTANITGFKLENDGFNKIANRCFNAIINSEQWKDTQPGEKEFMIMFVKAIGNILNDTYNIKKIYLDLDNEK